MLNSSLHTLLRYTHHGYVVARRIVLGLACCMLVLYSMHELSASEATAEEATVQCPHAESASVPAAQTIEEEEGERRPSVRPHRAIVEQGEGNPFWRKGRIDT